MKFCWLTFYPLCDTVARAEGVRRSEEQLKILLEQEAVRRDERRWRNRAAKLAKKAGVWPRFDMTV